MAKKPAKTALKPAPTLTRGRLDLTAAEHAHLRVAAAMANMSMAAYARKLVQDDMKRKVKP